MTHRDPAPGDPEPWEVRSREPGPDLRLFRCRFDELVNPRNGRVLRGVVLETPEWVNVVAMTRKSQLVLVRQYRFGTGRVTTEIPGGMVDPGERSEDAARRELREETGYTAPRWTYLGAVEPNPAFHDNLCHHWLAEDAVKTDEPELDPGEDIRVITAAPEELAEAVRRGDIRHSLVIAALSRVIDLRQGG